jgi:hypothetical protein
MADEAITFRLGRDEALVLFELLSDFSEQRSLAIPTAAEGLALIRLHGALEQVLVEPFRQDYVELLKAARARLMSG